MLVLTVAPVSIHSNANQYPVLVPFGTSTQYPVLTGCWRENLRLVHDLEITGLRKLNLLYSGCSLGAIATDPAWTNDRPSGIACSSSKQDISRSGPGMPRDERYAAETFFKAALYFWCKLGCLAIRAIRWRLACGEFRFRLVSLVESELLRHRTNCTLNYFCNFLWAGSIKGMSSKNTLPFAGRFCFSWHPAPASSFDAASIVLIASLTISRSDWAFVGFSSERRQAVRGLGQPWFYLRLASGAALWLCWVVREDGAIACFRSAAHARSARKAGRRAIPTFVSWYSTLGGI